MEHIIAKLLQDFERGYMSRRQLIQSLAMTATAAVAAGVVFQGAYATDNSVTVTIGGIGANISWTGLVGPGLYLINVTIPSLPNGDHAVVATVGGIRTQASALLKIAG